MRQRVLSEGKRLRLEAEQLRTAFDEIRERRDNEIPKGRELVITEKELLAFEAKALKEAEKSLEGGNNQFSPGLRRFTESFPSAPRRSSIPSTNQAGASRRALREYRSPRGHSDVLRRSASRNSSLRAPIEPKRSNFSKYFVMVGMALSLLYGFLGRRGQADAAEEAAETFSRLEEPSAALMLKSETYTLSAEDKGASSEQPSSNDAAHNSLSAEDEAVSSVPNVLESPESLNQVAGRADFNKIIDIIMRLEGGWTNDPHDSGGETYKGITVGTMADCRNSSNESLQRIGAKSLSPGSDNRITDAEIREIYKKKYWDKIGAEGMPECFALVLVDASVNHGVWKAQQFFRIMLDKHGLAKVDLAGISSEEDRKLADCFIENRRKYYKELKGYSYFGEGWENRMDIIKQECQAMYIARVEKQPSKEGALSF